MSLYGFNELNVSAIGTRGTSKRLAAYRAALAALDKNGLPLAENETRAAAARPAESAPAVPSARTTIAPKPIAKASAPAAAQIEQARQRARHNTVMNSPHAKGRQCTAAGLLGGAPDLSAEQIIAMLPTMPTDAKAVETARRARVATMWERAIAANSGKSAPVEPERSKPRKMASNDPWDRVIAGMKR